MALIDRVKLRIETDLSDAELQAMIDEVTGEIEHRFGKNAAITMHRDGGGKIISFNRPIDEALSLTVVEIEPRAEGAAASETTLAADDYRVLSSGRTLERLIDGTNGRSYWAPLVKVTYTPVSDAKQRDEVVIQVTQLEIQARGLSGERAGDWQASYPDLAATREKLIQSLAPRRGLAMA